MSAALRASRPLLGRSSACLGLLTLLLVAPLAADADDHGHRGGGDHRGGGPHGLRDGGYRGQRFAYPYVGPIYAPPPVYAQPLQSPGISLFLPLDIRR